MTRGTIYEMPRVPSREGETVVTSTCGHNCGGRCVVNAHVVDGRIVKISTDPRKWTPELPPLHACVRGFGQVERVYHPDRLKYPMRRTGPRGTGRFERISWDAALDEVACELLRIRDTHGHAAILDASRSGSLSMLHGRAAAQRFLYMFGGCTTPSGKIEVYSMALAANPDPYGLGRIPPIPTWIPPVAADPRHPLMLCTPKSRARTHSVHGNQEVLARADRDDVWMHPDDAAARGIRDGQLVRVFNDRGATVLPSRVTDRIALGVVSIKEGAWFSPDQQGDDRRGCANVLTDDRSAPSGATTYNTNLVEVVPA